MRPGAIKKLISRYVRTKREGDEPKTPDFYSGILIGPPPPDESAREPKYANEERWDWWKSTGQGSKA